MDYTYYAVPNQEVIDENEAKSLEEKIKSQKFDLNDF